MMIQDVTDTSTLDDCGLNTFLVAPLTRDTSSSQPAPPSYTHHKDLMFFMTRSYQTLTYSDGGD